MSAPAANARSLPINNVRQKKWGGGEEKERVERQSDKEGKRGNGKTE